MAWDNSHRRAGLPPNWNDLRRQVFERDGYRCTHRDPETGKRCAFHSPDGTRLECDHVVRGNDHSMGNLATKCGPHHRQKTARESAAERWKHQARARLPQEVHPATLEAHRQHIESGKVFERCPLCAAA